MRFGFRAIVVALLSLLTVIACVAGENQCLNPQPDLPSCRDYNGSGPSAAAGGKTGSNDNSGAPSPAAAAGSAGSSPAIGLDPGAPANSGGASGDLGGAGGDFGGAGGDSATESAAGAGASGAAGSDDAP